MKIGNVRTVNGNKLLIDATVNDEFFIKNNVLTDGNKKKAVLHLTQQDDKSIQFEIEGKDALPDAPVKTVTRFLKTNFSVDTPLFNEEENAKIKGEKPPKSKQEETKTNKHKLTEKDFKVNPDLKEKGLKVGDEIEITDLDEEGDED